jgi:hypothetical protein
MENMNYPQRLPEFDKYISNQTHVLAYSLELSWSFDRNGTGE